VLQVLDGLRDVRVCGRDAFFFLRHIIDPLEVAIVKAAVFQIGQDESRVVEIGAGECALPDPAAVEVHMDEFGILETAVEDIDIPKGTEIHVHAGKIAGVQRGRVEETEAEGRAREHHMGERRFLETTADEAYPRKIGGDDGNIRKIHIYGVAFGQDGINKGFRCLKRRWMVIPAIRSSRKSRFRAALDGAGQFPVHIHRLHHRGQLGKGGAIRPLEPWRGRGIE